MFVLDTCTLIWLAQDRNELSEKVSTRLKFGGPIPPVVSAISAFELAIKVHKGKLTLPLSPEQWFPQIVALYQLRVEPILWEDAVTAAALPPHHNDPMDRIIIATAKRLGLSIATPDPLFQKYTEISVFW